MAWHVHTGPCLLMGNCNFPSKSKAGVSRTQSTLDAIACFLASTGLFTFHHRGGMQVMLSLHEQELRFRSRVWSFEAHSCASSKRRAQTTLSSNVPACFHFRLVQLHLGQQRALPTDPLLPLILTTKHAWILPPHWNIEPSHRIFPLSKITLAMSLIICPEDSDSTGYYSRVWEQILALSVSDVRQSLLVKLYQSLNDTFVSAASEDTVWDLRAGSATETPWNWYVIYDFTLVFRPLSKCDLETRKLPVCGVWGWTLIQILSKLQYGRMDSPNHRCTVQFLQWEIFVPLEYFKPEIRPERRALRRKPWDQTEHSPWCYREQRVSTTRPPNRRLNAH